MDRITVSIEPHQREMIDELAGDGGPYESRSEVVRAALRSYEQVEDLEREVERLNRERRQLLEQREENQELVRFAEEQRSLVSEQRDRQNAPVWRRAKWWVFGGQEQGRGQ